MKKILSFTISLLFILSTLFSFSFSAKASGSVISLGEIKLSTNYELNMKNNEKYNMTYTADESAKYRFVITNSYGEEQSGETYKFSIVLSGDELSADESGEYAFNQNDKLSISIQKYSLEELIKMNYTDEDIAALTDEYNEDEELQQMYSSAEEYYIDLYYTENRETLDEYFSSNFILRLEKVFRSGDYYYEADGENANIIKYSGDEAIVRIPEYLDSYKVNSVKASAFSSAYYTKIVEISEAVKNIDLKAFDNISAKLVILAKDASVTPSENTKIKIYSYKGSSAESFANENSVDFEILQDNYSDFSYRFNGSRIIISAYNSSNKSVALPTEIIGYSVSKAEAFAFGGKNLEITVPNSVMITNSSEYKIGNYTLSLSKGMSVEDYLHEEMNVLVENGLYTKESAEKLVKKLLEKPEDFDDSFASIFNLERFEAFKNVKTTKEYLKALEVLLKYPIGKNSVIKAYHKTYGCEYAKENSLKFSPFDKHTLTKVLTKKATCTAKGEYTYTCDCGYVYKQSIPMIAHKAVKDKAVAATFKKAGKTEGSHCSVCDKVIKAQKKISKLGAPKLSKVKKTKTAITAKWKKVASVDGYEIQYSTKKNFKKGKATKTAKSGKKATSKKISKLAKRKTYYVKIRAYKTINGKKQYSSWSAKKTVKL